jgi:hypothetical protein
MPLPLAIRRTVRSRISVRGPRALRRAVAGLLSLALPVAAVSVAAQPVRDSVRDSTRNATRNAARTTARADSAARPAVDTTGGSAAARALAGRPAPVWPVAGPPARAGALLPGKRIIAYYGNPRSRRMGILGEIEPEAMMDRLEAEAKRWAAADPSTPVQPALHLIAVVAQGDAGRDGKYRGRMSDSLIAQVHRWARSRGMILFLDIQVGLSTIQEELPRFEQWLRLPDVHVGIDPEFSMKTGAKPGTRIGTYDADDVNWVSRYLARIVDEEQIPPKVLVVHRFTRKMLTNTDRITLDPRVQVVIQMDGWGPPRLKRDSYEAYVYAEPVQYTGFKLFYKNDTKKGHPLMTPEQVLTLFPKPLYIQYQ